VANAARNNEILHERDGDDIERPDKRSGDRHQPTSQQSSHRSHGHNNDRQGSDRRSGSDNHRSSNNNYSRSNSRINFKSIQSSSTHEHDPNTTSRGPSEGYSYPVCTTCGRRHQGECRRAVGTCFKCGQAGHLQKDCKKNTTTSTSGQADKKPGASGRVFAITEGQAANTSGTITGTLFINGHAVFVLFDTGATHSVISFTFASRINTTPTLLDHVLCISTPMQDSVRITHVYRNLPLQFDDKIRAINAFPLDMCEFDLILGMDWLTEHHATIDCHSYRVIFGDIQAPHCYEGFLATIHDTTPEVPSIYDKPIVLEFPDVFPDELPGLQVVMTCIPGIKRQIGGQWQSLMELPLNESRSSQHSGLGSRIPSLVRAFGSKVIKCGAGSSLSTSSALREGDRGDPDFRSLLYGGRSLSYQECFGGGQGRRIGLRGISYTFSLSIGFPSFVVSPTKEIRERDRTYFILNLHPSLLHESARNQLIPEPFVLFYSRAISFLSVGLFHPLEQAVKREIAPKETTYVFLGYAQSGYRRYAVKSKILDISLTLQAALISIFCRLSACSADLRGFHVVISSKKRKMKGSLPVLTWEAGLDLKRSMTIIQKEKDQTKEGGDDSPRMGL
nr:hypothetical protein [Tanacetum cinerariifolium]